MTTIQQIKSLISKGKTEEALKCLIQLSAENPDIENQALLLSGQYQQWEVSKRLGILESDIEVRRIQHSILDLLDEDGLVKKVNKTKSPSTKNEPRGLESYGEDIKQFLEKEKLEFSLDSIKFSKQQNFVSVLASLTRAYDWNVEVPVIIPTNHLFLTLDSPSGKIILGVEHLKLSPKLNIYAQNSSTVSSKLWDIKTAKDAEFWSSINNITQTMVDHKIKNEPEFKRTIHNRALQLINEKISNFSNNPDLSFIIGGIKLYEGSIEKVNL